MYFFKTFIEREIEMFDTLIAREISIRNKKKPKNSAEFFSQVIETKELFQFETIINVSLIHLSTNFMDLQPL